MIHTIGHSTHSADTFLSLLTTHRIGQIADVRTIPRSTRHPQFNRDTLAGFLDLHGIAYRHFPALGGRRRPRPDSENTAWREDSFRGYADHMETAAFGAGLVSLLEFAARPGGVTPGAAGQPASGTAVMCAEAVWWRCHRRLLADALVARGIPVLHILSAAEPKPHELSEFARLRGTSVIYPGLV